MLDEVWHNRSAGPAETFTQMSLNARKLRAVRHSPLLGRLAGVDGRPTATPPRGARSRPRGDAASAPAAGPSLPTR